MSSAAFFDLDRTLIEANSGLLWALHERAEGNISRWQFVKAVFWSAMYHLALIDMDKAFGEAVRHYRGHADTALDERTRDWFHQNVASLLRPAAAQVVAEHRERGEPVVILTNSSCYEARVAAEAWGFDDWLANVFPVDSSGKLTGEYERPMCYGQGKVIRAEAWAQRHGVALERSYFYTDSYSDLPMLERVAEPRVVSPDPRLKRAARRRGWPILQW